MNRTMLAKHYIEERATKATRILQLFMIESTSPIFTPPINPGDIGEFMIVKVYGGKI